MDNPYARSFKGRIGYLHAINFKINFINYQQLSEFDYFMVIDDDSWFKEKIAIDLFEELDEKGGYLQQLMYGKIILERNILNTNFLIG